MMDVPKLRREAKRIRDEEKPDLSVAKMGLDGASGQDALAIASLVFMRHRSKLKADDWPHVARWAQGIEAPETADLFAENVAGPLYAREPEEALATRWARSAEPALRRLALRVAGIDVAEELLRDEDERVQEALVDALRELGASDPKKLLAFLKAHPELPEAALRRAAAALPPELALALTTGRLPHRARTKAPMKSPAERSDARKEAVERARVEREKEEARTKAQRERAARELEDARAAMERAKKRLDDLGG